MANKPATIFAALALCLVFLMAPNTAHADTLKTDADEAVIAIVAVAAAIGIGVYLLIHHSGHSLTGCAAGGPNNLQLRTEGNQQTYSLIGDVAGVTPGHRVRVSGKKQKGAPGSAHQFLVEKTSKDFGPCTAAATP